MSTILNKKHALQTAAQLVTLPSLEAARGGKKKRKKRKKAKYVCLKWLLATVVPSVYVYTAR